MSTTRQEQVRPHFRLGTASVGQVPTTVVEVSGVIYQHRDLVGGTEENSLFGLLRGGEWDDQLDRIQAALVGPVSATPIDARRLSWQAPICYPNKLVCIGANYTDHIREMGLDVTARPPFPYSFAVPATTTLVGTGSEVVVPSLGERVDWEAEVAVVIGQPTRNVAADQALAHVAAYGVLNDMSARDWSGPNAPAVGIDWVMAKAHDGFKPMAPFITPARFVPHPEELSVRSWVNGELMQNGTTADMWFNFAEIVEHLSRIMTLEPGDIIATGTPSGVGHGRKPPRYLAAGDRVVVEVASLGSVESTLTGARVAAAL